MGDRRGGESGISRRALLARGGALAAAGALGVGLDAGVARAGTGVTWPSGQLGFLDAFQVNPANFMPVQQFADWAAELDQVGPANQLGLRATGSAAHESYIDELLGLLTQAGVTQVEVDPVPFTQWLTDSWGLEVVSGSSPGPVTVASYMPYSGQTPADGVTGELVYTATSPAPAAGSLAGKIALFELPLEILVLGEFDLYAYLGKIDEPGLKPFTQYKRPVLNYLETVLPGLEASGAAGIVAIMDWPASGANGFYFPYTGAIGSLPGLYVDRDTGAALKTQAQSGVSVTLTLPATVANVTSRNVLGFIPGRSSELVALHCHTDGVNSLEDNGPGAIIACAQYLARLPQYALPRTLMILLTTGHFAGGIGVQTFCEQHATDLIPLLNAAVTTEHLGALEWEETSPGVMGPTGSYEIATFYSAPSSALVNSAYRALLKANAAPAAVLRPTDPTGNGTTTPAWPGEGEYLYAHAQVADANYITGPTYLLNWGIAASQRLDFNRIQAEAIAFTEQVLQLSRLPRQSLTV